MNTDQMYLKDLYAMIMEYKRNKYPNTPQHLLARPNPYNLNKTNDLTKAVIKWIEMHGYHAERISTTGRYVDNRKKYKDVMGYTRVIGSGSWIPGTGTKGSADISATIAGRSVKIEIKNAATNDRQSEAQRKYQESIEKSGGVYLIVRTFSGFVEWWKGYVI